MANSTPAQGTLAETQDDEVATALKSTFAIASVGIATLRMLETLLPAAASEVERESKALSDNFTKLIEHVNSQCNPPMPVADAINRIIMGMQFQDRNTQVMENVVGILQRYRNMLEEVCNNIETTRDNNVTAAHNIAEAVDNILSGIRLSDIRSRYLEALAKAKVHNHSDETASASSGDTKNDIELF